MDLLFYGWIHGILACFAARRTPVVCTVCHLMPNVVKASSAVKKDTSNIRLLINQGPPGSQARRSPSHTAKRDDAPTANEGTKESFISGDAAEYKIRMRMIAEQSQNGAGQGQHNEDGDEDKTSNALVIQSARPCLICALDILFHFSIEASNGSGLPKTQKIRSKVIFT